MYQRLTDDMGREISSEEIQLIVREIIAFTHENASAELMGENHWEIIIDTYSTNYYIKAITDTKYEAGASDYIATALQYYFQNKHPQNN